MHYKTRNLINIDPCFSYINAVSFSKGTRFWHKLHSRVILEATHHSPPHALVRHLNLLSIFFIDRLPRLSSSWSSEPGSSTNCQTFTCISKKPGMTLKTTAPHFHEGQIFKVIISGIQRENTTFKHWKWKVETPNETRPCKKWDVTSLQQTHLSLHVQTHEIHRLEGRLRKHDTKFLWRLQAFPEFYGKINSLCQCWFTLLILFSWSIFPVVLH